MATSSPRDSAGPWFSTTGRVPTGSSPSLPVRSVAELVKFVKERPGKLSYSSTGPGGPRASPYRGRGSPPGGTDTSKALTMPHRNPK